MRTILNIVQKEARELLTPQMLVPFVAMMFIFLVIGRVLRSEFARSSQPQTVLVCDLDQTSLSAQIRDDLAGNQLAPVLFSGPTDSALAQAQTAGINWVIVIPPGTADSVARLRPAPIEVYNIIRGFSIARTMRQLQLKTVFEQLNGHITLSRLQQQFPAADSALLLSPLTLREFLLVKGRLAAGSAAMLEGLVFSQTFLVPIVLMMIIIYSSQMIAASIGQEKENKTLETLLTVPINRTSIVIGKMLGASLVAVVIAALFMVAMTYYMGSFTSSMPSSGMAPPAILASLDIGLTLKSFALVAVALLLAVIAALSLATLLAAFADDAKSAQMTTTPLMMLVTLPYLFTIFLDLEAASLPVKILVYALPFSYPFLTPRAVAFGQYGIVLAGFVYLAAFALVCIVIAARIFATDRILTAKLRFRRSQR